MCICKNLCSLKSVNFLKPVDRQQETQNPTNMHVIYVLENKDLSIILIVDQSQSENEREECFASCNNKTPDHNFRLTSVMIPSATETNTRTSTLTQRPDKHHGSI